MCLAIQKSADKILTRELLRRGFEANGDGAGFAYSKNGELIVEKGFWIFKDFWKEFREIQEGNPCLVHFRLASSGPKNKTNCHPFLINENLAVVHNGTLSDFDDDNGDKKSKKSDTLWFVDSILKPLFEKVPDAHLDYVFQLLLEKTIGTGNKMVFLDSAGRHTILRAWVGEMYRGSWFSNDSYQEKFTMRDWRPTKPYKPKNQTEQLLGAPSQLGKINTGRDENLIAINEYLSAMRSQDASKMERFISNDPRDPSDVRAAMLS